MNFNLVYSLQAHIGIPFFICFYESLYNLIPDSMIIIVFEYYFYTTSQTELLTIKYLPSQLHQTLNSYLAGFAYIMKYQKLSIQIIKNLHKIIDPFSSLIKNENVICGNTTFLRCQDMKKIYNLVKHYNETKSIQNLAYHLLTNCRIFEDGNGRLVRILISWHFKKLLYFKTNQISQKKWLHAINSHSARELGTLIRETANEILIKNELRSINDQARIQISSLSEKELQDQHKTKCKKEFCVTCAIMQI